MWRRRRGALLFWIAVLLALDASATLLYEFWRLVLDHGAMGGVDLASRVRETHAWFAGSPVYGRFITAVYPPATYALLWPFTGWLPFSAARWLWAIVLLASLAALCRIVLDATRVREPRERAVAILAVLALYATGQTIGDGQLLLPVLPLAVAAVLVAQADSALARSTVPLIGLLVTVALVKPQGVLPMVVVALLATRRKAAIGILLAGFAYLGLTLFAASFQPEGLGHLLHAWAHVGENLAAYHGTPFYANVDAWLGLLGLKSAILPVSGVIIVAFGVWTWRCRGADIWLLIGVAGYVARFWSYHESYDDVLLVLPMVALARVALSGAALDDHAIQAGALLALTLGVGVVPGGLYLFPGPIAVVFTTVETVVWLAGLRFLLIEARRSNEDAGKAPRARTRLGVPASTP